MKKQRLYLEVTMPDPLTQEVSGTVVKSTVKHTTNKDELHFIPMNSTTNANTVSNTQANTNTQVNTNTEDKGI